MKYCVKVNNSTEVDEWKANVGSYWGKGYLAKIISLKNILDDSSKASNECEYMLCLNGPVSDYLDKKRFFKKENVFRFNW